MATEKKSLSKEVIGALADEFDKSLLTVERWEKSNSLMLTTEKARKVFERFNLEWVNGEVKELVR